MLVRADCDRAFFLCPVCGGCVCVQASKAYGESGSPPKIPGGATLKFEIELISWESPDSSSA